MQNICVVDDDKATRNFLSEALFDMANLSFSASVNELILYLESLPDIDLFILDIVLTGDGGSGIDLCKYLTEHEKYKSAPVLFYTSHSSAQMEEIAFRAGGSDFLEKPMAINRLRMRVASHLKFKRIYDQLYNTNTLDFLTGLYKREAFYKALQAEINRACRGHYQIALLMIDLDKFKKINDTYGHLVGDKALIAVAKCMKNSFGREGELTCRFAGDEFSALTISYSIDTLVQSIEEFDRSVNTLSFSFENQSIPIRCSIGALVIDFSGCNDVPINATKFVEMITNEADRQLYTAKKAGRGRSQIKIVSAKDLCGLP